MNRPSTNLARLATVALPIVALTALGHAGAFAAEPSTGVAAAAPYRAVHLGGVTTGTYSITGPDHGIMLNLRLAGRLSSSGGCFTAQVGVRQSAAWRFTTVADACSTMPVTYQASVSALTTLGAGFGVRVCAATGGCGPVTQLPSFGTSVPSGPPAV